MDKLGIVLPTNQPREAFNILLPSIQHLTPLKARCEVHFLFNFQPPWTISEIATAQQECIRNEFFFHQDFNEYDWKTPRMGQLFNDAAKLLPDATWWLHANDNFRFMPEGTPKYKGGSAERYLQVIDYFSRFPNCGVVQCEGSLGGTQWRYKIKPTSNGLISTARGLWHRNLGEPLYDEAECALVGGLSDLWPAYRRMAKGLFCAKQFNSPTRHMHRHYTRQQDLPETHFLNYVHVVSLNGERHVRQLYRDPEWELERRYFPKYLWKLYADAGGDTEVLTTERYCVDYEIQN